MLTALPVDFHFSYRQMSHAICRSCVGAMSFGFRDASMLISMRVLLCKSPSSPQLVEVFPYRYWIDDIDSIVLAVVHSKSDLSFTFLVLLDMAGVGLLTFRPSRLYKRDYTYHSRVREVRFEFRFALNNGGQRVATERSSSYFPKECK
jgi:hypothetical protein